MEVSVMLDAAGGAIRKPHAHECKADISDLLASTQACQESLNSRLLRQWFLDNLSDPFPNRQTKETLVWKTNALLETASPEKESKISLSSQPIDIQQCALWFINSRRRSQWTTVFRRFAHSDKQTMKNLMDILLAEEDVTRPGRNIALEAILEQDTKVSKCNQIELSKRVEDCRELFSSLMEWLRQKPKQKVGDWMDEVIEEAKMELKEEKKALREERERLTSFEGERDGGQKHQKRKSIEEEMIDPIKQSEDLRRSRRIVKRRFALDDGKGTGFSSTNFDTPNSMTSSTYLGGSSSSGSSSWSSSGSSRRVPSLFESNDSLPRSTSAASSTSSLASYDAFHQVPDSPTLRILKNSQAQHIDQGNLQPIQSCGSEQTEQTRTSDPSSFQLSHTWPTEA